MAFKLCLVFAFLAVFETALSFPIQSGLPSLLSASNVLAKNSAAVSLANSPSFVPKNVQYVPGTTEVIPSLHLGEITNLQFGQLSQSGELPIKGIIGVSGTFPIYGNVLVEGELPTSGSASVANSGYDLCQ